MFTSVVQKFSAKQLRMMLTVARPIVPVAPTKKIRRGGRAGPSGSDVLVIGER
jgi:hypothetical protein